MKGGEKTWIGENLLYFNQLLNNHKIWGNYNCIFFFVLTHYTLYFRLSNWINQIYFTDKLNKCVCREREKNYIVIIFLKHKVMDNALQFYFCCQLLYKAWPIGTTILLFSFLLRKKKEMQWVYVLSCGTWGRKKIAINLLYIGALNVESISHIWKIRNLICTYK